MKELVGLIAAIAWVAGIAVAEGFWATLFAVIIPMIAWVFFAEWIIKC